MAEIYPTKNMDFVGSRGQAKGAVRNSQLDEFLSKSNRPYK